MIWSRFLHMHCSTWMEQGNITLFTTTIFFLSFFHYNIIQHLNQSYLTQMMHPIYSIEKDSTSSLRITKILYFYFGSHFLSCFVNSKGRLLSDNFMIFFFMRWDGTSIISNVKRTHYQRDECNIYLFWTIV